MKLRLVKIQSEAKGTKSFFWQPLSDVDWLPGQYFYYTLPKLKEDDPRGATRQFTIASSPTEKGVLRLTTRFPKNMSGFKKTLLTLKKGDTIEGDGPSGIIKFDETQKDIEHVFLAGGVGITPFRSMIKFNIDKKQNIKMHLIYSNSFADVITFRDELQVWAKKYKFFTMDMTVSQDDKAWTGKKGRIDADTVKKLVKVKDAKKTAFWAVGPSKFVYAMEGIIDNFKLLPENKHIEIFTGY